MYLRNRWYCAATTFELGGTPLGRVFLDEPVVMYRREDGAPVALEDRCCHRRVPLSKGKVEGDNLRCGYHGFLYDNAGACIWIPGDGRIPPGAKVRSYPIVERHGWLWIWMGDATAADESLVPDFHQNTDPAWASTGERLYIEADYLLLVDNLMDLSHVAFLHEATIGSADDIDPDLVFDRGDDFVRGTRSATNMAPPPRIVAEGVTGNIDQTKVMTFTPPANVVIDIATKETDRDADDPDGFRSRLIIFDSMTPETERSCHYFWAAARDYALDDTKFTEFMHSQVATAFDEDKVMLEAQQVNIDRQPTAPQIDVGGDAGGLQSRRVLDRLIAAENGTRAAAE